MKETSGMNERFPEVDRKGGRMRSQTIILNTDEVSLEEREQQEMKDVKTLGVGRRFLFLNARHVLH